MTKKLSGGQEIYEPISLTASNLLDPQIGKVLQHSDMDLYLVLKNHYRYDPIVRVFSDFT